LLNIDLVYARHGTDNNYVVNAGKIIAYKLIVKCLQSTVDVITDVRLWL